MFFDSEDDDLFVFYCGCIFYYSFPNLTFYPCSEDCVVIEETKESCAEEGLSIKWLDDDRDDFSDEDVLRAYNDPDWDDEWM